MVYTGPVAGVSLLQDLRITDLEARFKLGLGARYLPHFHRKEKKNALASCVQRDYEMGQKRNDDSRRIKDSISVFTRQWEGKRDPYEAPFTALLK